MPLTSYFILNGLLITISQSFLILQYFKSRRFKKVVSNLLVWFITVSFLFYDYYFYLNIPKFIITCAVLTIIGHCVLGNYLNYYHRSKRYDRGLHLFGSFSFSLLAFFLLNTFIAFQEANLYSTLFVITLGISIGTLFEILEFIHDSASGKAMCQHGLTDTNYDMIFNAFGSLIAGLIVPYL